MLDVKCLYYIILKYSMLILPQFDPKNYPNAAASVYYLPNICSVT